MNTQLEKTLARASHVDPRLIRVARLAATYCTEDFGLTAEQSRTVAQEAEEEREGFSHTSVSHHEIDIRPGWAAPGCSGAIDLVAWNGVNFVWEWPRQYVIAAAMKRASIELGIPVTWGGRWDKLLSEIPGNDAAAMKAAQTGFDGPHFELGRNT